MHTRLKTVISAIAVSMTLLGTPAHAAMLSRSWPVTPGSMGSLYGTVDPGATASVRLWGPAMWCYVQPTADADVSANLEMLLRPALEEFSQSGSGFVVLTIGHPAPWVFNNHPKAVRSQKLWTCGNHSSSVSIPSYASLAPQKNGSLSEQAQRWATYVGAYVDWLRTNFPGVRVVLESWNEPNLSSGLAPGIGIPGAARTAKDAGKALHRYDRIAYDIIRSRGAQDQITIGTSALFTRSNTFSKTYLGAHNRNRAADSVHVNVYGLRGGGATPAVIDWDRRASKFRQRLNHYKRLRVLPLFSTEANLNLVNNAHVWTNLRSGIPTAPTQRRMATATVMNAYFHGYRTVFWLIPWGQQQAAVALKTEPGNPARESLAVLRGALEGRQFVGCSSRRGVRTCTFVEVATGARSRVLWRNSEASKVSVSASEVLEMTGEVRSARGRESITTTPIVVR